GSYPRYLINVSGHLFFQANDGTYGTELWDPPAGDPAPATGTPTAAPTLPAPPPPAGSAVGSGMGAPASPAASPPGVSWWQQALWLEALLLDLDLGALAGELTWLDG